jgi:ATP-binding cassette subfamily D (ALD) protein 2
MPTVISKYLENASKYKINKEHVGYSALVAGLLICGCKLSYPYINKLIYSSPKPEDVTTNNNKEPPEVIEKNKALQRKKNVPGFNREFVLQLYQLVRLLIPTFWSKEVGLLFVHTLALITRTFMSIYVATMEGRMVKFIVQRDVNNFAFMLLKWLGVALPATFLNSLIRYLESKIALAFR